jgi:N-acetylneuraminate synthase/N,N'-diacetyllegionaminate synthase
MGLFPLVVQIGPRLVGNGHPCYVIAEAGVNHNGDIGLARKLVEAAAEGGADAVKFQTFRADALASEHAEKAAYQKATTGSGESQRAMLERLELPEDALRELKAHAERCGIAFLSTPFDPESARLLAALDVPAFKVSSGDLSNLPFLRLLGEEGKPILLSTGMAYLGEVEEALMAIRMAGPSAVVLLHCVSSYPADPGAVNLRAIETMAQAFRVPVGLSDHTLGTEMAVAAVARSACLVEKHLTVDRGLLGPDHRASLEPVEFRAMVRAIRNVEAGLGDGRKIPHESEREMRSLVRKSLVVVRPIPAGATIAPGDVDIQRPGTGLHPRMLDLVIGRRAGREIPAGTLLAWSDFE